MSFYELETLIDNLYLIDQQEWEMTRNLAYFIVQPQTKHRINPQKLMSFPWDNEGQKIKGASHGRISDDVKEQMMLEAKYLEEKLANQKNEKQKRKAENK